MTIQQQIEVFEPVAKWIDPEGELQKTTCQPHPYWIVTADGKIATCTESIALAIRKKQAGKWIEAWCANQEDKHGRHELSVNYCVFADGVVHITVGLRKFTGLCWAAALAAAVEKLAGMEEEEK